MPSTNFFFNNFKSSQEQNLLENLIIEAISIYGEDMYFIPRNLNNFDQLYTADDQSSYTQTFQVPLYIENINGFTGDGNFMSKFGLEIRDQVVLSIAQRVFNDEVGAYTSLVRPREGDLIFFPLNNKCFQIKFVDKFEMYYQLGKLYTWKMTCELFEYSNEVFNTGIPEIDSIQANYSTNVLDYSIMTEAGEWLTDEDDNYLVMERFGIESVVPGAENETLANGSNNFSSGSSSFIDFTKVDPFSEGLF
jgi:hypothetical protein